jgi:magnesium transporter
VNEDVLSKFLLLAFFIPLVLTLSESSSMQSVAQSLQFLRRPRFHWKIAWIRSVREWQIVALLALTSGILVGGLSLFWGDGFLVSFAIGIGIIAGVIISSLFAISVPIILHRLRLDPKVAAGPVVLMIVDILTTAVYLGLATWWLL